jgi:hypothetical protein
VAERLRYHSCSRDLVRAERPRHGSGKDIALAGIGRMAEQCGRRAEIFPQNFVRRVLEPVADIERVVFVEVAIIENQKEFDTVGLEALDKVRNARWEIPTGRPRPRHRRSSGLVRPQP